MSSINNRRPYSESPRNTQTLTLDAPLVDDCKLTLRDSVRDNIVLASPGSSPRGDANVIPSSQSCNGDLADRLQHLKVTCFLSQQDLSIWSCALTIIKLFLQSLINETHYYPKQLT